MGIVIGSSVVPVVLTLSWTGLDGRAMSLGAICGPFLGFLAMLIGAANRPGGLYYFLENTGLLTEYGFIFVNNINLYLMIL